MRNEINLTDDQIEDLFEAAFSCGITVDDLDFTRDTIDQFVAGLKGFVSHDKPFIDEQGGFKTLDVSNVKIAKGKPTVDVRVIDFGTVRAIYQG
jgi:hypothetical protein